MRNENGTGFRFGEVLRQYREANGLSVEKLAGQLGLTRQMVHGYERGAHRPSLDALIPVASIVRDALAKWAKQRGYPEPPEL